MPVQRPAQLPALQRPDIVGSFAESFATEKTRQAGEADVARKETLRQRADTEFEQKRLFNEKMKGFDFEGDNTKLLNELASINPEKAFQMRKFEQTASKEQKKLAADRVKGARDAKSRVLGGIDTSADDAESQYKRARGLYATYLNQLGIPNQDIGENIDTEIPPQYDKSFVEQSQRETLGPQKPTVAGAGEREFDALIENLTEKEKETARRIKVGLDPRAVGSAAQTITTQGTAEEVAESEAIIAEGKKFAEMQGSQRSQAIDKGFDKVQTLSKNIINLGNAIEAVRGGAATGAITKRFPSIRESSVLLDQVQGALALDVIGSVTFGALSEGELNLAKAIAIPTGLEGPALIEWLQGKKEAQQKLLSYFEEQIDFLDQGGSVAGFLRSKKRQQTKDVGGNVVLTTAKFGDITEEDISETMRANNLTREQVVNQLRQ